MTNSVSSKTVRRKRSGTVVLTTMAALGGGAMLSGCGEASAEQVKPQAQVADKDSKQEVQLYENVFACAKETGKSREECTELRNEALAVAHRESPRFEAISDCEQQFGEGKCLENKPSEESTHRRSYFSPFLAGFLWGSATNKPVPAFSAPGGGYQTSRGVRLGYAGSPGKYYAGSRALQPSRSIPKIKAASAAAKKAGFGETSRGWTLASRAGATSATSGGKSGSKGG